MTATPDEAFNAMCRAAHSHPDEMRAALRAARDLGWRLVPEEATEEMERAGDVIRASKYLWACMINAAPDLLEEK